MKQAGKRMNLVVLISVILLSKVIFLLSLLEVKQRSEMSENRIVALENLTDRLANDPWLSDEELRALEDEVDRHQLGPQIIPLDLSVGLYMLVIPTSFWVFITSIRAAVHRVRSAKP